MRLSNVSAPSRKLDTNYIFQLGILNSWIKDHKFGNTFLSLTQTIRMTEEYRKKFTWVSWGKLCTQETPHEACLKVRMINLTKRNMNNQLPKQKRHVVSITKMYPKYVARVMLLRFCS